MIRQGSDPRLLVRRRAFCASERSPQSLDTLFQQLSPALFPPGRWPRNGHYSLVFGQQFALNAMVQDLLKGSGLFTVNGPPSTGKTTLLREVIAAVVVEKATRLSELVRLEDAFAGEEHWKVGNYNRVVSIWKEGFRGFEIVVASNNNGAVENVTLEIPGKDAVDPSWIGHTHYFSDVATRLTDQPAWAMVAARLGKKANRHDFMHRFWYGGKEADDAEEEDPSAFSLLKLLRAFERHPADLGGGCQPFQESLGTRAVSA